MKLIFEENRRLLKSLVVVLFFSMLFVGSYLLIYGPIAKMALDFFLAFSFVKKILIIFIFAILPVSLMIIVSRKLIGIHLMLFLLALPINEGISFISIVLYMIVFANGDSEFGTFLTSPAYFFGMASNVIIIFYYIFKKVKIIKV